MPESEDSILVDIKKLLGIDKDYNAFDQDIIIHINSVFMTLLQLGVGPKEGFCITGDDECWSDYNTDVNLNSIKSYMYLKVRQMFDPPQSSVSNSFDNIIKELEWRIVVQTDDKKEVE